MAAAASRLMEAILYNARVICTACRKNEAVLFVKTLVDNQLTQAALCASCAGQLQQQAAAADPLLKVLSGLAAGRRAAPACPACQTSYEDFRESGRFGCPSCYDHFAPMVRGLLPRLHGGAYHHRGKAPRR